MSKQASEFQYRAMSLAYRGKEIFKPLNTGWIDDRVACVREYVANVFFYVRGDTTIMIDAGYNYERLEQKMGWLGIDPANVHDILITHQDTDHVGAVEEDSPGLFRHATLYVGEVENRYLTGEKRRRVYWGTYKLPQVTIRNRKKLLYDGDVFTIGNVRIEAFLVPGHTWGHLVYLVDDAYLFTGDTIWFGADGGRAFLSTLAESNKLSVTSLNRLERTLRARGIRPKIITGHTGWTDDLDFAFARTDEVCHAMRRQTPHDPRAPYDAYVEDDDTEVASRSGLLPAVTPLPNYENWVPRGMVVGLQATTTVCAGGALLANKLRAPLPVRVGLGIATAGASAFAAWSAIAHRRFSYDGEAQLSRRIVEGTASHVRLPEGGTCLDVGCGSGALAIAVAKRNPKANIVGLDRWGAEYASFSKRLCERNARAEGVANIRFEQGDATKLPFADGTFDCVTSNYVYHNVTGANKQDLLKETLRVLKPGGTFVIHDIMSSLRYGNMQAFCQGLRDEGYQDVRLVCTDNGLFMGKFEATALFLTGSTLLMGTK